MRPRSLKDLTQQHLKEQIQSGEHDPVSCYLVDAAPSSNVSLFSECRRKVRHAVVPQRNEQLGRGAQDHQEDQREAAEDAKGEEEAADAV